MSSYPPEAWKALSPEDKAVMLELKQVFGECKYSGETAPEGVLVFPETEWESRGYWHETMQAKALP